MPIITGREQVKRIYEQAAERGWVIPCICTENLTTTEAILTAAEEFALEHGMERVPITLAITLRYEHRSQASYYTNTRDWSVGLKLFYADAVILAEKFKHVDLLLHLDHVQYDLDEEFLKTDLSGYSSIMYDASALPMEENIERTRAFVEEKGGELLIEGACDEIVDAGGEAKNDITTPEKGRYYMERSGVDMVVANLGTEHRASGKELQYHGDAARLLKEEIGTHIVLHGTSSVTGDQIRELFADGICKVNIWTAVERDSSPELFAFLVRNAEKAAGEKTVKELMEEGFLTEKCLTGDKLSLSAFTTAARQEVVFQAMKRIVREYLDLWYVTE